MLALVEEGLAELDAKAAQAAAISGGPRDRLRAACSAYLDYAEQKPGLFRLLLGSLEGQAYVLEIASGEPRAYHVFERLVREIEPSHTVESAQAAAALVWAQLHGYAVLKAGGLFARVGRDLSREATLDAAVRIPTLVPALD